MGGCVIKLYFLTVGEACYAAIFWSALDLKEEVFSNSEGRFGGEWGRLSGVR